jgi:hypothetical protein
MILISSWLSNNLQLKINAPASLRICHKSQFHDVVILKLKTHSHIITSHNLTTNKVYTQSSVGQFHSLLPFFNLPKKVLESLDTLSRSSDYYLTSHGYRTITFLKAWSNELSCISKLKLHPVC